MTSKKDGNKLSKSYVHPDAVLNLFFKALEPYRQKGGTLIAGKYGKDNHNESLSFRQGIAQWGTDDYMSLITFCRYVTALQF